MSPYRKEKGGAYHEVGSGDLGKMPDMAYLPNKAVSKAFLV